MAYKLISETTRPHHDGEEHLTVIRMYDVDDETLEFLYQVQSYERDDGTYGPHNPAPDEVCDAVAVSAKVLDDLGLYHDFAAAPGALYHTYGATLFEGVVIVSDTVAYNI